MEKKIFWCKNCLNMSTRPRISFDERGWCNACQWSEEKKKIDWSLREKELSVLLDKMKSKNGDFDCITTVSGGKDGSYVSHVLKTKYGMNPLAITVKPALSLEIGNKNLQNFINSGYNHIHISPNPKVMDRLNKYGFIEKGFPYYGWLIAIMTAVIKTATKFKIPLIFYGEDGEVEYGGSQETKNRSTYDIEYMKRIYLEGGHQKVINKIKEDKDIKESDLEFFTFPNQKQINESNLTFTHMSYYEPWDSYRNYIVAKDFCGLEEIENGNDDTFTNFSQNDQALYSLHAYLMYLKFGFGRATQDAGIEIRRGAMKRSQALNLVKMYDNTYPEKHLETYLKYYNMEKKEFDSILDKFVNKQLFKKVNGVWCPKFTPGETFSI
jgi:N-acetyl sugar amidotransferase